MWAANKQTNNIISHHNATKSEHWLVGLQSFVQQNSVLQLSACYFFILKEMPCKKMGQTFSKSKNF